MNSAAYPEADTQSLPYCLSPCRGLTSPRPSGILGFPNDERLCRSLCLSQTGKNRGFSCFCHHCTSWGVGYELAEQRPVSVRTGGLSSAGERCSVIFVSNLQSQNDEVHHV